MTSRMPANKISFVIGHLPLGCMEKPRLALANGREVQFPERAEPAGKGMPMRDQVPVPAPAPAARPVRRAWAQSGRPLRSATAAALSWS